MTALEEKVMFDYLIEIRDTLKRMEQRQIKTTAMVEDVKDQEVGSFGSIDKG